MHWDLPNIPMLQFSAVLPSADEGLDEVGLNSAVLQAGSKEALCKYLKAACKDKKDFPSTNRDSSKYYASIAFAAHMCTIAKPSFRVRSKQYISGLTSILVFMFSYVLLSLHVYFSYLPLFCS